MSENEQAQERTEQPSARRLEKSRKQGQVARSRELNTVAVVLAGGASLIIFGQQAMASLAAVIVGGIESVRVLLADPVIEPDDIMVLATGGIEDLLLALTPVMVGAFIAAVLGPAMLGGFTFSGDAVRPKLSRLSPLQGLKRVVSAQGLMELVKTILKFTVLTSLAFMLLWSMIDELRNLGIGTAAGSIGRAGGIVRDSFLIVAGGLLLIASIDVPFVIWNHLKRLRMTKQELRDEHKETEGSPETKARIQRVQRELASRRMMQDVPLADVVLTNPTHYSVALSYTDRPDRAPRLVAKGKGLVAARIRELAEDNDVPVCESPLLTRAIFFNTEIGADIPTGLYLAVARVLVWVMNVRTARETSSPMPVFPADLPVPGDLRTEPRFES